MNIALFDLDHTISDASVRDHMIPDAIKWGNFDAYHSAAINDQPISAMCQLARTLIHSGIWRVAGLTTREEKWRTRTNLWLSAADVPFHELLMRGNEDKRPTQIVKLDLVQKRWPALLKKDNVIIFDDRASVIKTFSEAGFASCLVFAGGKKDESLAPN